MFNRFRCMVLWSCVFFILCEVTVLVSMTRGSTPNPVQGAKGNGARPVLTVTPKEIDFGAIGPAEGAKGVFVIKNAGSRTVEWSLNGPEGWSFMETEKLSGSLRSKPQNLKVHISSLREEFSDSANKVKNSYPVQMTFEINQHFVSYQKHLMSGAHREMLKLVSNGGAINIFVRFKLVSAESEPLIHVEPTRMDFGVVKPGDQVSRRVKVTNRGRNTLKWLATIEHDAKTGVPAAEFGRYISFLNEELVGNGVYMPPLLLKDAMELSGKWSEQNGYPSSDKSGHVLRFRFLGTGISVFFSTEIDGGDLIAYVDENVKNHQDCQADPKERTECMIIAEGLVYGPHTLTVSGSKENRVTIEGVRTYGKDVLKGTPGWISIFPDSGTTNRETDFVNIAVNTQQFHPGYYGERILFESNGGQPVIEVSLEVSEEGVYKILDIYRYVNSADYLFSSSTTEDAKMIQNRGYRKQGIAFRLFSPGTPGTTAFYRWYHPGKKIHFYSYDRQGEGKSLKGYSFEGTIGHIGTSRLTNTRALYRWFNPVTQGYFYTTDPNGEDHLKKGYRFDGIAGYVR